jgi:hypothetical protein
LGGIQTEGAKFVKPHGLLAWRLFGSGGRIAETFGGSSPVRFFAHGLSRNPFENS